MKNLSEGARAITDINVTPLVDVILVILIIFMATAPLIHRRALTVDIPAAAHQERAKLEALQIVYNKNRELFMGGELMKLEELSKALSSLHSLTPGLCVLVSADKAIPYGDIIRLLDIVRGAGLKKVSLEVKVR